jgi:hypothetical protein
MFKEKKNERVEDPINMLLKQALIQQRVEMMENFAHILQHLPITTYTSSSSDHFGGTSVEITKTTERGGESVVTVLKQFYVY